MSKRTIAEAVEGRHPATQHFAQLFAFGHLPPQLAKVSEPCHDLAVQMVDQLADGAELSAGLRKLREAKDCFVSQAVLAS